MIWWEGGRRPSGFSMEHPANTAAVALVERLRRGIGARRRTWILDITNDLGVPVVAAVSVNSDGRGLACGFASRLDYGEAAKAAILELFQMEMSAPLAEAKRAEAGEGALNDADRRHLRRAAFEATECDILFAKGLSQGEEPAHDLDSLVGRLISNGAPLFLFDMTRRDIGVSVVRAMCPALQPFTATVSSDRLKRAQALNGGSRAGLTRVPLM